jgi:hypothetical protein
MQPRSGSKVSRAASLEESRSSSEETEDAISKYTLLLVQHYKYRRK